MSQHYNSVIHDSVRSGGQDTVSVKPTHFLNLEAIEQDAAPPKEASFQLWTDEHSALSKERRENRENNKKGHVVAEVEDFDLKTHLDNISSGNDKKPKWKFW